MLGKFTLVLTMVYIITFNGDYRYHVLQAEKHNHSRNHSRPKVRVPTFRDLPYKKLYRSNQIPNFDGKYGGYMRVVNQLNRINATKERLKVTVNRQNKTIFRQTFMLQRQEKELRRQRDKLHTYKAQIRSYQGKLIDKGVVSDIIIVSAEKIKRPKKNQNVTDELCESIMDDQE